MGSCLCLRKSELIVENENEDDEASTASFEPTPYKWAVINPRPSLQRLLCRQQQHQTNQLASQEELNVGVHEYLNNHPFSVTHIPESYCLTCLDVLEAYSRNPESYALDASPNSVQQKQNQEEVSNQDKSTGISPQMVGSPAWSSSPQAAGQNERSCVEDQLSSSTFSHIFKSESTFSHITAEFGESDESSLCGSPRKPLLQEKMLYRENQPEPKIRIFSPKYGKLRCSQRLSKKFWASEQEALLQKSPTPQQRQSF